MGHATTMKFNQQAFRRGVDDIMTVKPLRDAVTSLVKLKHPSAGSTLAPKDATRQARDDREPARRK